MSASESSLLAFNPAETSLPDVLRAKAASNQGRVICYPIGNTNEPRVYSYLELLTEAVDHSQKVRLLAGFNKDQPTLLYLDDFWDVMVWFWAVLLAGGLAVVCPSFPVLDDDRHQRIQGLSDLLHFPMCITREKLVGEFLGATSQLQLYTIESMGQDTERDLPGESTYESNDQTSPGQDKTDRDLALLMLTSGSTGKAKAVRLTHKQILAAVRGKASVRRLDRNGSFLNWIALDHVASLIEMHIQALWLDVDQVHVNTTDIVQSPRVFLDLLTRHRVCRTFAPNFFLARLVAAVQPQDMDGWDLSNLQIVASGGEANSVQTIVSALSLFQRLGARGQVITPGFGMTETCAGAIFNLACPDYDLERGYAMTSVGKCVTGIEMRVSVGTRIAGTDECGDLEVRGDVVFDGYYGDAKATADAFPSQGWFRTGDKAFINSDGSLSLIGRKDDEININSVKVSIAEVEARLDKTIGDAVARFVVFPSRAAHTEQITIAYVPKEWPQASETMTDITVSAIRVCLASFSARPLVFALTEPSLSLLPVSSLGKISRAKMSALFEAGVFEQDATLHANACSQITMSFPFNMTKAETLIIHDVAETVGIDHGKVAPDTVVFDLGFTSMDLIRLKHRIDIRLGIAVPVIVLVKHPTARLLAAALEDMLDKPNKAAGAEYDPVVPLVPNGNRTPLWLLHPGVGEVLVFVGLARHLTDNDRPIYAMRARGFEPGQTRFRSIAEAVETYVEAVRRHQPRGPYALAGYSYGAMLAFEMAKRLDAAHHGSVRFLGNLNLPPHIKSRMRQLNWSVCLAHLVQFLDMASEQDVDDMEAKPGFATASRCDALAQVVRVADQDRMKDLGLNAADLARWADVAYGLQSMAVDYEPEGQVDGMDIFHADPLRQAAASRDEWLHKHLSRWSDFTVTGPRFHLVGGAHYTMIGPRHVAGFARALKDALAARAL